MYTVFTAALKIYLPCQVRFAGNLKSNDQLKQKLHFAMALSKYMNEDNATAARQSTMEIVAWFEVINNSPPIILFFLHVHCISLRAT